MRDFRPPGQRQTRVHKFRCSYNLKDEGRQECLQRKNSIQRLNSSSKFTPQCHFANKMETWGEGTTIERRKIYNYLYINGLHAFVRSVHTEFDLVTC